MMPGKQPGTNSPKLQSLGTFRLQRGEARMYHHARDHIAAVRLCLLCNTASVEITENVLLGPKSGSYQSCRCSQGLFEIVLNAKGMSGSMMRFHVLQDCRFRCARCTICALAAAVLKRPVPSGNQKVLHVTSLAEVKPEKTAAKLPGLAPLEVIALP